MKVVRELGLERRETVRFLSTVKKNKKLLILVREDRIGFTNGVPVILSKVLLGS